MGNLVEISNRKISQVNKLNLELRENGFQPLLQKPRNSRRYMTIIVQTEYVSKKKINDPSSYYEQSE
ncbi:hypothetical protein RclHR1_13870002 [Rhizophagus clarus]|uniref:Uncharacterized protein n=1 Tax=Rhizophagus clarus TaxID=94130 RepID=A0A2Z6QNL4_9GLOM|nr:hypothetical protein RclHR1_13870002 [Rhizophagus clarus]